MLASNCLLLHSPHVESCITSSNRHTKTTFTSVAFLTSLASITLQIIEGCNKVLASSSTAPSPFPLVFRSQCFLDQLIPIRSIFQPYNSGWSFCVNNIVTICLIDCPRDLLTNWYVSSFSAHSHQRPRHVHPLRQASTQSVSASKDCLISVA